MLTCIKHRIYVSRLARESVTESPPSRPLALPVLIDTAEPRGSELPGIIQAVIQFWLSNHGVNLPATGD